MKKFFLLLIFVCTFSLVNAKNSINKALAFRIESAENTSIMCNSRLKCKSPLIAKFYAGRKYTLAWVKDGALSPSGTKVLDALKNSTMDGLDPRVYHIRQLDRMVASLQESDAVINQDDIINLDLTLSDGLLLYLNNLVYGWQDGKKLYPTWPISPKKIDVIIAADKMIKSDDVDTVLHDIAPKYSSYWKLRDKLAEYYKVAAADGGWEPIPDGDILEIGSKGSRVSLLQKRLYISGELSNIDKPGEFTKDLEKAVILYQQNNGIDDDGAVGSQTLRSLNVPVTSRIRQIELNMDRMRFLPDDYPSRYAVVNVPDYSLETFEEGKLILFSPVVVGKSGKQTCILNSQIITVEVNPFWNVPFSIASKEMLPEIKANTKYLADNDIKVFKVTHGKYDEIDPKTIDWTKIESGNLNFRFRQNPGDDNALGKLKFIFPNNCSIYLHDSPFPELFDETQRGFSHGCIRVGQPVQFADYLLSPNKDWDEKAFNTELDKGTHKFVKLSKPVGLYIIYLTAWYSEDEDFIQFRNDIYKFDQLSLYPVYLPQKVVPDPANQ